MISMDIHVGDDYGFHASGKYFKGGAHNKAFSVVNNGSNQGCLSIYYYDAKSLRQHAAELLRLADEMEANENA